MKHRTMPLLLLAMCLLLASSAAVSLHKALASAPSATLHAASASPENVDMVEATLYYRFASTPMLAAETRTLTVRRDETAELSVVRALLEGPSAGNSDLSRIFPESVQAESVSWRDHTLYITFNEALLSAFELPSNWATQPEWEAEAPLRRKLAIQSVVASLTESFPYTGVQILVHRPSQALTSLRLDNAFFLTDLSGLSDPFVRDESLLLTPQNTAYAIISAWQSRDYDTLYQYVAATDAGEPKPIFSDAVQQMDAAPSLFNFSVSGGSVSPDGQRCVVVARLEILNEDAVLPSIHYPLALVRENDVWKITVSTLAALLNR